MVVQACNPSLGEAETNRPLWSSLASFSVSASAGRLVFSFSFLFVFKKCGGALGARAVVDLWPPHPGAQVSTHVSSHTSMCAHADTMKELDETLVTELKLRLLLYLCGH